MTMAAPWRDPKTGVWKLKKRVPTRYLAVAGQAQIKISTGTADRAEAGRRWPGVLAQYAEREAEWDRALHVMTLDDQKAREVAAVWAGWIAAGAKLDTGDHDARRGGDSDIFELVHLPEYRTPENIARMWDRVEAHADEAVRVADLAITTDSRLLLLQTMLPVVMAAYQQADLSVLGATGENKVFHPLAALRELLPDTAIPAYVKVDDPKVSFGAIFASWKSVATVVPRVAGDVQGMMAVLERYLGHDNAATVTTGDLRRWRDAAVAEGLNNNTWNGRLSMIGGVFDQAVKDGRIASNPADNKLLRLSKMKPDSPLPYSDAQAAQILVASRLEKRASVRWAHWIMAFTGMRVAEVLQLSVSDLRNDGGMPYISINADGQGKSVKTSNIRHVPIHSALIREGLLAYAATLPPEGQLFPDKLPDKYGMIGGRAFNVVGRWVRDTVGLTDKRLAPNHSWRHRMEDEMRDHGVADEVRDAICGHASKSTGRLYGVKGVALRRLAEAVELLKVPEGIGVAEG